MPTALIAAFLGAIIGFAGTYLLQRGQFRRADLEGVRERLGLTRTLRVDLYAAKILVENSIKQNAIAAGTTLPTTLWSSHGHRLIAALNRPAEAALIDAFGRFSSINGIVAATKRPDGHLPLLKGELEAAQLQVLVEKIDTAVKMLDALEAEYEGRELRLRHPIKSRLSLLAPAQAP